MALPAGWTELKCFTETSVPVRTFIAPSGLRVCLLRCEGPLVTGYAVLATEATTNDYAHRDDGLPHTLEHLIFLGSEKYPYKGVLDKLANRCLAQGTNAWTDVDHTAYTITTAGSEGFLNLLPIYMDHVLYPTLTEEAFVTEIHHITGEGENKGVVYCEMQGRENKAESLVDRACLDLLYPDPKCGYNAETGGKMVQLRELTNAAIRRYHREFYRPNNCCLIVTGGVDAVELLSALNSTEKRIAKGGVGPEIATLPRPWLREVEALKTTGATELEFPSEDESTGFVCLCWRGPHYTCFEEKLARKLLWDYLSDSSASPLKKAFVETDDALAGDLNAVSEVFRVGYDQLWFEACATDTLSKVPPLFEKVLAEEAAAGVDMSRMATVIMRHRRKYLSRMEDSPADQLLWPVVKNFLYANRDHGLEAETDVLRQASDVLGGLDAIQKNYDQARWLALLRSALIDAPKCVVLGRPSATKAKNMSEAEEARTKEQAGRLKDKLGTLAKKLEDAVANNETPPPDELLASLPIPDTNKVEWIAITTARDSDGKTLELEGTASELLRKHLLASREDSKGFSCQPALVQWTHVASVFVKVMVALDTTPLPASLRSCLPLLLESAFKLAVANGDGTVTPAEEVIEMLQRDTISFGCTAGSGGGSFQPGAYANVVFFWVKTEASSFETAVATLKKILFSTVLDPAILKVQAAKLLAEVPNEKRSTGSMASALMTEAQYGTAKTNHAPMNAIRQGSFLERVVKALEAGGEAAAAVVADLEECRRILCAPSAMRIHIATDILKAPTPYQTLSALLPADVASSSLSPTKLELLRASAHVEQKATGRVILGLSTAENSTLRQSAPGLGPHDPALPALMVAIEHLTGLEGDFWCKIRGLGLSYGYAITNSSESQRLSFSLSSSTDPIKAHAAAKAIIQEYATGAATISDTELESTKSAVIFGIVEDADTKSAATALAWNKLFAGKEGDYERMLMGKVLAVTRNEAMQALRTHLVPLFDAESSALAVVTPLNKVDVTAEAFDANIVREDALAQAFPPICTASSDAEVDTLPQAKYSRKAPSFGRGYAAKLCECPRCEKPPAAV